MKKLLIGILSLSLLLTALVSTVLTVSANGSLTLAYDSMPDGSLYMTFTADADAAPKYYWADVTVDGTAQRKVLEIGPDWAPNNAFFWGLGATQSVEIAAGAVLPQCDPNTGDLIVGGKQLTLTETFQVVNENGEWKQVTEVAELTLSFRSVEGGSSLYMGFTAPAAYTQKYYWVDVTADGASARMLLEIGPDWAADHAFNWSFSATESLEIAAGAEVVQCDPNSGELIAGGKKLVLTEAFAIYNTANGWTTDKPIPTADLSLTFRSMENGKDLYLGFTAPAAFAQSFYWMDATVDGAAQRVLLEVGSDWAADYAFNWGCPATETFAVAAGTILKECDPTSGELIAGGKQLVLTEALTLYNNKTGWSTEKEIPTPDPLDLSMTFEEVNEDGAWSYLYECDSAVAAGWFVVTAVVDGTERLLPIEFYKDGERFYHYAHTFNGEVPAATLTIAEGAVLTPISDPFDVTSVVAGGQPLKLVNDIDVEKKDGAWVDNNAPQPIPPLDPIEIDMSFVTVNSTADWAFTSDSAKLPTANTWYAAEVTMDGEAITVLVEYDVASGYFYVYHHCFAAVPDDKAANPQQSLVLAEGTVLHHLSAPDASALVEGGQPLKLTNAVTMEKKDGAWVDKEKEIDLSDALSVGVTFHKVDGTNILWLNALLADDSAIMDLYGDWTTAYGTVRLGTYKADGTIDWVVDQTAIFSITGSYFHMSGISLANYDAIQIDGGMVMLPAATCKSDRPIVIVNNFGMMRNEDDEWVVDKEFSETPEADDDTPSSAPTGDKSVLPITLTVVAGLVVLLTGCVLLSKKKQK